MPSPTVYATITRPYIRAATLQGHLEHSGLKRERNVRTSSVGRTFKHREDLSFSYYQPTCENYHIGSDLYRLNNELGFSGDILSGPTLGKEKPGDQHKTENT